MTTWLLLAVFCPHFCLASEANKLSTWSGTQNITFQDKSSTEELLRSVFAKKQFSTLEPTSNTTHVLPSEIGQLIHTDIKDKNENKRNTTVQIFKRKEDRSGTTTKGNGTSTRPPSDSNIHNDNFQKSNRNLNTFAPGQLAPQNPEKQAKDHSPRTTKSFKFEVGRLNPKYNTHEKELEKHMIHVSGYRPTIAERKPNAFIGDILNGYKSITCLCKHTTCDCSNRGLKKIPQNLAIDITELFLTNNSISVLPKNAFSRYQMLENLVMSINSLDFIKQGAFNGLGRLISLDLSKTDLGTSDYVPDDIFEPLKSLTVILLDSNLFICSGEGSSFKKALAYLHSVKDLKIDYYGQDDFGPEYKNMSSLQNLTMTCEACNMSSLSNETFQYLNHIAAFNISSCGIIGSRIAAGTFSHFTTLQTLDVSHNPNIGIHNFPVILLNLRNSNLSTLIMSYIVSDYEITELSKSIVELLPRKLTKLVARGNNILSINIDVVKQLPKSLRIIDINENNLIVDPRQLPLNELVELETLFVHSNIDECLNNYADYTVKSLCDNLPVQGTEGSMEVGFSKNEMSVNITAIKTAFPVKLKSVKINVQDMHYDIMANIDERNNIEALDLSCSYLSQFCLCVLDRLPNLRCLNLRKSSIREVLQPVADFEPIRVLILQSNTLNEFLTVHGGVFSRLRNLSYLDLSLNQLSFLRKDLLKGLHALEYLRLDYNSFSYFGADISKMAHLKLLNLSHTELPQLPSDVRAHINHLCKARPGQIRVDMSGCPIQCDCFNLDFLKWMISSPAFDQNFTGYKCQFSDTSIKFILDGYQETIRNLEKECAKNFPIFLIVLAATSVLVCVAVGAIVHRLRWKIRYFYYAAYLKVMDTNKKTDYDYLYDVFLSYDSEDKWFVTRQLSPELEKRGLKLLIHTRDFVAGTYIASNIVMAVAESRKTLVVLTRNLLESDWCNYELQMATMEAVHTGRQVLIFLLKEDIPDRELDFDLLRHIRSNTYVPYPGPEEEGDLDLMAGFYDKLAHDLKC